jgi:hypothetical protein
VNRSARPLQKQLHAGLLDFMARDYLSARIGDNFDVIAI